MGGAMRFLVAGYHGRLSSPPAGSVHGGFATLHFGAEFAKVTFHKHTGEVIYSAPVIPRRSAMSKLSWCLRCPGSSAGRVVVCLLAVCILLGAAIVRFGRYRQRSTCDEY